MKKQTKILSLISMMAVLAAGSAFNAMAADVGWRMEDGEWRYYDSDGNAVTDTWKKSEDNWYYLDSDGFLATDCLIDDGDYLYGTKMSGRRIISDWAYLEDSDGEYHWYYFQSNGKAKENGFLTLGDKKYHFTDGKMDEGWLRVDDDVYLLNQDEEAGTIGAVVTGWVYVRDFDDTDDVDIEEEGWYYFQTNGKMLSATEKKINGQYYAFDDNGLMLDNWVEFTDKDGNPVYKYYKTGEGRRVSGWRYLEEMSEDEGRDTEEGWYYFKNGIPYSADYKTTKIADGYGVAKINSKVYCFDEKGCMVTGKVDGENGEYFYFDEKDDSGIMKYGRVKITDSEDLEEGTYYFADKGSLGEKGKSQTGVVKGYLYENGELVVADDGMKYQKFTVDGKDYLVSEAGKVKTSGTVKDGDGQKWSVTKDSDGNYIITEVD